MFVQYSFVQDRPTIAITGSEPFEWTSSYVVGAGILGMVATMLVYVLV